ncbi:MAG: bifunctional 4-hydroxy-3-methylbut-2-enyl diphosphate reductase/30S ribosomal protein S1 [Clostridia bacterium]|nr:bifunctional 4-hydroxy-3-methylbut-2-enyl diphosphate reductase/30S ribosomal protein S1 [Clostridia bacterium]
MQIIVAPYSGFCFGVKRAVKKGEEIVEKEQRPIASLGPLIHNPQEITRLKNKGIIPRDNINDIEEKKVLIRTHGVPPEVYDQLKDKQLEDCTCPFVKKVQQIANEYAKQDYTILIMGNKDHPEVKGILGWALNKGIAFQDLEELNHLNLTGQKICFVAQTTENTEKFNKVVSFLEGKYPDLVVFNTICSATLERQKSAWELANKVDLMLVVGGLNSANTQQLADLCRKTGVLTKHIEKAEDIEEAWFDGINAVGVTAGASTPDWIIEEVVRTMEEIKNNVEEQVTEPTVEETTEMQEQWEQDMTKYEEVKPGDILTGKVVQINNDEVLVDVGGKSEGIIPSNELSYRKVENPNDFVKVGQEIKALVLKAENSEGNMILSKRRADQEEALVKLEKAFEENSIIEAEVIEVVKGGVLVDVGMRGFVPASLMDRGYVENLEQFIGQKLKFKVIEFNRKDRKAVLSRKAVLDEEYEQNKAKLWNEIEPGQTRKGVVQRITDFGAFVDLGGVDGLLHVSEMGWGRVNHPRDVVKEGDQIEVYVLAVDKEKERISLGLKQLIPSPWETAAQKYSPGSTITGKVVRIAPFGVFVEVEPGIDGLVHISQLAWERVEKPEDVVSIGQEVEAKVLDVDPEKKRMSLSIKEATSRPVKEKKEANRNESYPTEHIEPSGVTIGDVVGDILNDIKNE